MTMEAHEIGSFDAVAPLQQSLDFLQNHIHYFTAELYHHFQNIERHSNQQQLTAVESSQLMSTIPRGLKTDDHCMHYDNSSGPFALRFHFHTLHWQILQLLLGLSKNHVQLSIPELLPIVKKIMLANKSADTRHVAMKVVARFMQSEPQKLVNELLVILHQAESVSDVTSAAACLTDVIIVEPANFSSNAKQEIIKHVISLLRMEYSVHKTVLYCFAKLWDATPKKEQQAYLKMLFGFTDNKSSEIRQGIVRLFLEINVKTIVAENVMFIINHILRLLPIENNNDFLRFACEALKHIQINIADSEATAKITFAFIKLVETDKFELRVLYALKQLDFAVCAAALAARPSQAERFINRLLAMLTGETGDFYAAYFLEKMAADQRFAMHHDRIKLAMAQFNSSRVLVELLSADASPDQSYRSSRPNKGDALFKRANDIFWRAGGQSRQHSNLFVLLDTVLHDHDCGNCWNALRELVALFDKVTADQQRKIIDTMKTAFTGRPELRHNILSNLSAFDSSAFADEIFTLYINTYISSEDKRLCALCKEIVIRWSFLPKFFKDYQQVTVGHLKQLGQMIVRFDDVEFVAQAVDLCIELVVGKACSVEVKSAALQAMLEIATNANEIVIQLQIIGGINQINVQQNLPTEVRDLVVSYYAGKYTCGHRLGWPNLWAIFAGDQLQQPIDNWLEQGLAAFNRSDYAEALQCFTNGIRGGKRLLYLLHFYRGRTMLAMRQSLMAIKEFNLAEQQYPDTDYSQIHYYRALAYIEQNQLDDAVANLRDAIQSYPYFLVVHEKLAEVYYRLHHIRRAREIINDIREFKPEYTGFRSEEVEDWLATRADNYSLVYFPRQTELDALYSFVADNTDDIQDHIQEVLERAVTIFSEVNVNKVAAEYGFCAEELSEILYTSEKRRYVMQFIQALLLRTFWQEYHNGYRVISDERARQSDLQRLAKESQIVNIFREVGVPNVDDVDSMLHTIKQHCLGAHGVFDFLRLYVANPWLRGGYALGATNDIGSTYSVFTRLFDLQRWETVYGQHWLYDTCNSRPPDTSYGVYQILDSNHHTDQFFQLITKENKPIIFFVPTNMGVKKNSNGVTYGELAWVAQAIKQGRNDLLKNIMIVFDAYNYLPLHMLREGNTNRSDVSALVIDDQLLTAVTHFLATHVVAKTARNDFFRIIQENLQQDHAKAIHGEILTELILIVHYNSRWQPENNEAKQALLTDVKNIVDTLFDRRDPVGFFVSLERRLQQLDLNHPYASCDVCHCVQFILKLLTDADYVTYVNAGNQAVDAIASFIQQTSLFLTAEQHAWFSKNSQIELVDNVIQIIQEQTKVVIDSDTLARLLIVGIGQNANCCTDLIEYFNTQPITAQRHCLAAAIQIISQATYEGAMKYGQLGLTALLKLFEQPQGAVDFAKYQSKLLALLNTLLRHERTDAIYESCQQLVLLASAKVKKAGQVNDWVPSVCCLILVANDATHALQCLEQLAQHNTIAVAAGLNRFFSRCNLQEKFLLLDRLSSNRFLQLRPQVIISAVTAVNSQFNSMSESELTAKLAIICRCYQAFVEAKLAVSILPFKVFLKNVLARKNPNHLPSLLAAHSWIKQLAPPLNQEVLKTTVLWLQKIVDDPAQLTRKDELFVVDLLKKHANKFSLDDQLITLRLFVNGLAKDKFKKYRTELQRKNKNFMSNLFQTQDSFYLKYKFEILARLPNLLIADGKTILNDLIDCLGFKQLDDDWGIFKTKELTEYLFRFFDAKTLNKAACVSKNYHNLRRLKTFFENTATATSTTSTASSSVYKC